MLERIDLWQIGGIDEQKTCSRADQDGNQHQQTEQNTANQLAPTDFDSGDFRKETSSGDKVRIAPCAVTDLCTRVTARLPLPLTKLDRCSQGAPNKRSRTYWCAIVEHTDYLRTVNRFGSSVLPWPCSTDRQLCSWVLLPDRERVRYRPHHRERRHHLSIGHQNIWSDRRVLNGLAAWRIILRH